MHLRLRHRHRVYMDVRRLLDRMTYLNALHPRLRNDVVNQGSQLGIWFEHLSDDGPARTGREVVDRRRT